MGRETRQLILVWAGLMLLLAATVAVTFSPLPTVVKPGMNLLIAGAKAALIVWVYMHLREQPGLNRVVALGALAWLVILVAMTLTDVATRA